MEARETSRPDIWFLYTLMLRTRLVEEGIMTLWKEGLISGEMHLGTGEEAIVAGVVSQLVEGDAMALDHRGTSAMLMRGVDPVLLVREMLGREDGLCGGMGGHMHLFSKEHLSASSGIVGASGPTAAGFALATRYLRPGKIAVAFFGDGAINQGMLMESMNLASAWKLPVIFVCKDDTWAITTESRTVTGGSLSARARGLGVEPLDADGRDVTDVWEKARAAIVKARSGAGPVFIHAKCVHLEGHFLGYQLLRAKREPLKELPGVAAALAGSFLRRGGATAGQRMAGMRMVMRALLDTIRDPREKEENDPVQRTRAALSRESTRLRDLEEKIEVEVASIFERSMSEVEE